MPNDEIPMTTFSRLSALLDDEPAGHIAYLKDMVTALVLAVAPVENEELSQLTDEDGKPAALPRQEKGLKNLTFLDDLEGAVEEEKSSDTSNVGYHVSGDSTSANKP